MNIENAEQCAADLERNRPRLPAWVISDAWEWADARRHDPAATPDEQQRAKNICLRMIRAKGLVAQKEATAETV